MIGQETVRMQFDAVAVVADSEESPEFHAVDVSKERRLMRDTPIHQVVPAALDVDSSFSSHEPIMNDRCHSVTYTMCLTHRVRVT